jgi:ribokinase
MSAPRIVVVGSSNTDLVVRAPTIPTPGETVLGSSFMTAAGGKGANQAVAAARLGATVTFVGRLGSDDFGDAALSALEHEGIDVSFVVRDPEAPSGVAFIVVSDSGENAITVAPGANSRLTEVDVERAAAAIQSADALLLQLEIPMEAVRCAVRIAGEAGTRVILNPAPAAPLDPELLACVDTLTPNQGEAAALAGSLEAPGEGPLEGRSTGDLEEARTAAKALCAAGARNVVVTLGAEGALIESPGEHAQLPGVPVKPIDTTAAGDAFSAALAVRLASGDGLAAAAEYANRVAAIAVTQAGAQPSLPKAGEVEAPDS